MRPPLPPRPFAHEPPPWPVVTLAAAFALAPACTCERVATAPPIVAPFRDDFDRASLGPDWHATDEAAYRIEQGQLVARAGHNHPLWLARPIPRDARIEFDATSNDPAGDIKVEAWGDGRSFATDLYGQYTSTAYNFIFGGWHNTLSTLARMHEHGEDRHSRPSPKVVPGQRYHFAITRTGGHIDWRIDGQPFLSFDDAAPLAGEGHDHFAFTDWEAEVRFDNLVITPL